MRVFVRLVAVYEILVLDERPRNVIPLSYLIILQSFRACPSRVHSGPSELSPIKKKKKNYYRLLSELGLFSTARRRIGLVRYGRVPRLVRSGYYEIYYFQSSFVVDIHFIVHSYDTGKYISSWTMKND